MRQFRHANEYDRDKTEGHHNYRGISPSPGPPAEVVKGCRIAQNRSLGTEDGAEEDNAGVKSL